MFKAVIGFWLVNLFFLSPQEKNENIVGIWLTQEGNSKVEIYEDGGTYHGKIVWLEKTTDKKGRPLTDKNNPDKSLKDRPILGLVMLQDIALKDDGKGYGKIYTPKRGMTLDCELEATNNEELTITIFVRGFTRTQTWTQSSL